MQQADFVQEPSPDELLRVLAGLKAWPREHSCEIVQRFQLVEDDKILRMCVFHQVQYLRKIIDVQFVLIILSQCCVPFVLNIVSQCCVPLHLLFHELNGTLVFGSSIHM